MVDTGFSSYGSLLLKIIANCSYCISLSHPARFVPACTTKSSKHAVFCTARLLGIGRLSSGSKHIIYSSSSRRLPRRRCRDTFLLSGRGLKFLIKQFEYEIIKHID